MICVLGMEADGGISILDDSLGKIGAFLRNTLIFRKRIQNMRY